MFETIFLPEVAGTFMLLLGGAGVVANAVLPNTKGANGGFHMITWGWGLAVFMGVTIAFKSGGHLNPAVTLGLATRDLAAGDKVDWAQVAVYISAQLIGAFLGAIVAYLAYKKQFDSDTDPATKLAVFSTGPAVRSYGWNLITEIIGTFVLVFVVVLFKSPMIGEKIEPGLLGNLYPLGVALVVVAIGMSLGGPTGYAINPARDLAPRIAHALLPIPGKGTSDWSYAWVPVVGPLIGGIIGGLVGYALL